MNDDIFHCICVVLLFVFDCSIEYNTDYSILLLTDRVANWKMQNGPFGTLSEPELSQKKCSEELRSRSIDWRGQKFPRGHKNHQKGHHNF